MAIDLTSDGIIESIKRRASVPTSQQYYTTQRFLDVINEELRDSIVPLIMSTNEEWFVKYIPDDFTPTASANSISIPSDAIGGKVRDVALWNSGNNTMSRNIAQIYADSQEFGNGFIFTDNSIVFPGTAYIGQTIRIFYYRRLNTIVSTDECGNVTATPTATTVTIDKVPTYFEIGSTVYPINSSQPFLMSSTGYTITAHNQTWSSAGVNTGTGAITITGHGFYNLVPVQLTTAGTLPSGLSTGTTYYLIVVDANTIKLASSLTNAKTSTNVTLTTTGSGTSTVTATSINGDLTGAILDFASTTGISSGQWLGLSGETVFAEIPIDLYSLLTQYCVVRILESLGNMAEQKVAFSRLADMKSSALQMIAARSDGNNKKAYSRKNMRYWVK